MKLNRTLGLLLVATAAVGGGAAVATAAQTTAAPATITAATPAAAGKLWHHHQGGMLVGMMLRATHQLNLTTDQQTAIRGILSDARNRHQAAAAAAGNTPAVDLVALGNPGDPNYATALQSAKAAAETRFQNEVELQSQIYNVLTTEQKSKLPQVLADMKSKMQQRRATWQQQHSTTTNAAGTN